MLEPMMPPPITATSALAGTATGGAASGTTCARRSLLERAASRTVIVAPFLVEVRGEGEERAMTDTARQSTCFLLLR
jgi:hypothetical protein